VRSYIFSLINILYIKRVKKENRRTWKWCSGQVEDFRAQFKYQLAASAQISASQCQLQCIGLVRFTRNSWDTVSTMNSHPKVYGCPRQKLSNLSLARWFMETQLPTIEATKFSVITTKCLQRSTTMAWYILLRSFHLVSPEFTCIH